MSPELVAAVRDAVWRWDPYGVGDFRSEVPEKYDDVVDFVLRNLRTVGTQKGLETWAAEYLDAIGAHRHPPTDGAFVEQVWRLGSASD